jgi:hypothetical protein
MLFSGQLELEETLARRSLSALNQRVKTHQILDLLTRDESAEYLAERLQWAGAEIEAVFEEGAVGLVTHLCDGVPRCLNVLAEACLKLAEKRGAPLVSETGVRESFSRVRHLPLHWNELPEVSSLSATELPVDPQSDPDSRTNQTPATRGAESLETPDETVEFVVAEFGEGIDDPTTETFAANVSDDESDSVLDDSDSEFRLDDTVLAQRVGSLAAPQTAEELPTPIPVAIPMSSKEEFLPNAPASGTDLETRETTPVSAALPPEGKSNRRASVPISHNPVDIFAPDLPAHGAGNASTSRDDISQEIPPSTPASFPIGESQVDDDMVDEYVDDETIEEDLQRDLERLLAEARAADELDAIEPESGRVSSPSGARSGTRPPVGPRVRRDRAGRPRRGGSDSAEERSAPPRTAGAPALPQSVSPAPPASRSLRPGPRVPLESSQIAGFNNWAVFDRWDY